MCVVSMVADHYRDKWKERPWFPAPPPIFPGWPNTEPKLPTFPVGPDILTQIELDKLRKEVEEMKKLLERAKIYDEVNGEPHCEMEDKVELLRKIADLVGINLDDVLEYMGEE